jgi:hypothetical protein
VPGSAPLQSWVNESLKLGAVQHSEQPLFTGCSTGNPGEMKPLAERAALLRFAALPENFQARPCSPRAEVKGFYLIPETTLKAPGRATWKSARK